MNKLNKDKLQKISEVIEKYITLIKNANVLETKIEKNRKIISVSYLDSSSLLLGNKKNNIQKFSYKNANITQSAKNLFQQFEESCVDIYSLSLNALLNELKSLNFGEILPLQEDVQICIDKFFQNYEKELDLISNNMLQDVFNSGRKHQDINNKKIDIKKYINFDLNDVESYEKIYKYQINFLIQELKNFNLEIKEIIDKLYEENIDKKLLIDEIEDKFNHFLPDFIENIEECIWKIYFYGNLRQLQKDNMEYVVWKSGHYIDDCGLCRAYENGDEIIVDKYGNSLNSYSDIYNSRYKLIDILEKINLDGMDDLSHQGCRCMFIPA